MKITVLTAAACALALIAGPALAAETSDSPPEPYSAPDPGSTQTKASSEATPMRPKHEASHTHKGHEMHERSRRR